MAAHAVASPGPFLSLEEMQAVLAAPASNASPSALPPAASAAPTASGASAMQSEATSLLAQLDLILPASATGHGVTADTALKERLTSFLGMDPSDVAGGLKAAVRTGVISDAQYSQIASLLRDQSGVPTAATPLPAALGSNPPAPASSAAASPAPAADPAVIASAAKAQAALADPDSVFIKNNAPAEVLYQFNFDSPLGKAFRGWLDRSYGGITDGTDKLDMKGECPAWVLDKLNRGELLTEDEYKNLWVGIGNELRRNRFDSFTDISRQVGREVLQLGADGSKDGLDTSQGYLFEQDRSFWWDDGKGNAAALDAPCNSGKSETAVPGTLCAKGTSATFKGEFSIPEDKRGPLADFLGSLQQTGETGELVAAVNSGKVSAVQRDRILLLADQAAVVSRGGSVDELYASTDDFSEAIGEPVYTLDQYQSWL